MPATTSGHEKIAPFANGCAVATMGALRDVEGRMVWGDVGAGRIAHRMLRGVTSM